MNRFLIFAFALTLFAACSDDDKEPAWKPVYEYITFEDGTLNAVPDGAAVVPGEAVIRGSYVYGTYENVFWAQSYAEEKPYTNPYDGSTGTYKAFDGLLFSALDGTVRFGSVYSDGMNWGAVSDSWYGFAVSKNFTTTDLFDYDYQFSARTAGGARGSESFLACYYGAYDTYGTPTIEFSAPRRVHSLYIANSPMVYNYVTANPDIEFATFTVSVTGELGGAEVFTESIDLIDAAGNKVSTWVELGLGDEKVDKLLFSFDSNDVNEYGTLIPGYFCIDEIALVE